MLYGDIVQNVYKQVQANDYFSVRGLRVNRILWSLYDVSW